MEPIQFEDSIIGRVVFLSPTGWAVLPAWKEQQPLVAYSFEGAAPNSLVEGPIGFVSGPLLGQYRRFVLRYGDVDSSPGGQKFVVAREMWAAFLEGAVDGRTDPVQVGPLLDSNWHQNAPFNNLCPIWPGDGERSFAGCVAIAMAQIMKYHEWPVQGEGSSFYFWEGIIQISADYSDSYDWPNINNTCYTSDPQVEQDAVAELVKECGVSVQMDYAHGSGDDAIGSSADSERVPNALTEYFRYQDRVNYQERASFTDEEWFALLKADIDNGWPIYYQLKVEDPDGGAPDGHAVVCDGYRIDQVDGVALHMNYGWSGNTSDRFYYFPDIGEELDYEAVVCEIVPCGWGDAINDPGLNNLAAECAAWGDFNCDGYSDLFVGDIYSSPGRLFQNLEGSGVVEVPLPTVSMADVSAASWADYNNDGFLDLLVAGDGVHLFENDGSGTFSLVSNLLDAQVGSCFSAAWGDFNRDGLVDIILGEMTTSGVHIF